MRSLWLETTEETTFPTLPREGLEVDVAVIGGGIAGITTAYLLVREGKKVAVLESKRIVTGETGHTTAHVTAIQDLPFRTISSKFGRDGARRIASAGMQAIDLIERNVRAHNIDCDFERMPGYVYTEKKRQVPELAHEVMSARLAGLDCQLVRELPLPFEVAVGIRFENQARFHPRRYLIPLAQYVHQNGGYVFEHTHVQEVIDGSPCTLVTNDGIEVYAKSVVGATDAVTLNRFFLQTKVAPYRTYAIGLRVDRELHGLFYDSADPYHYIRTQPDPEGVVLVVGGQDHRVGEKEETKECYENLERYTRERFEAGAVDYYWSGQIEEPVDGLPYIGRNSASSNLYVATGFSGNGMVNGTIAGMVLSDAVLGRENPYAELLSATRIKPLASAVSFVMENADFPKHLLKDRLPARTRSFADVPPGAGRLVKYNGRKVAAYRAEDGRLQVCTAVCPHMGCHVKWNQEATSWDCPCHGSRFSPKGEVLHGPATRGLEAIHLDEEGAQTEREEQEERLPAYEGEHPAP